MLFRFNLLMGWNIKENYLAYLQRILFPKKRARQFWIYLIFARFITKIKTKKHVCFTCAIGIVLTWLPLKYHFVAVCGSMLCKNFFYLITTLSHISPHSTTQWYFKMWLKVTQCSEKINFLSTTFRLLAPSGAI